MRKYAILICAAILFVASLDAWATDYPPFPTPGDAGLALISNGKGQNLSWGQPAISNLDASALSPGSAGQVPTTLNGAATVAMRTPNYLSAVDAYGATFNGSTDDAPSFLSAWTAIASTGAPGLFLPAGTTKFATAENNVVTNLSMRLSPGTIVNQQLTAGLNNFPSTAWLYNVGTKRVGSSAGTLNATPTYYANPQTVSFACTSGCLKPNAGNWLNIGAQGSSLGGNSTYTILSVSGASSPYTVTLDRPIVFPFVSGDAVQEYTGSPQNVFVDGQGALISGTGDQAMEWARGGNIHIRGLRYDTSLGTLGSALSTGSVIGFDDGTVSSTLEDFTADVTGMTPAGAFSSCFYMQSDERSVFRNVRCKGAPANAIGAAIMDSRESGVENGWFYDGSSSAAAVGIYSLGAAAGFGGSHGCWIRGGGAVSTGYGIIVQGGGTTASAATDTYIGDWTGLNIVNDGIDVGTVNQAFGTTIEQVSATFSGGAGINIGSAAGTDTRVMHANVSHSGGGASHNTVGALTVAGSGVIADVSGLIDDQASSEGVVGAYVQNSGSLKLRGARINNAVAAGYGILAAGTRLDVIDSTITMTGHLPYGVYCGSGVCNLHGVQVVGPVDNSGTGLYVASGATAYIDETDDLSSNGAPLTIQSGGAVYVTQSANTAAIATTGGSTTLTWPQTFDSVISVTGTLASDATINVPNIPGWEATVKNGTTGAHNLIISGSGGSVTLPSSSQGSGVGFYVNSSSAVIQSSGPTVFATGLDTLTATTETICGTNCNAVTVGNSAVSKQTFVMGSGTNECAFANVSGFDGLWCQGGVATPSLSNFTLINDSSGTTYLNDNSGTTSFYVQGTNYLNLSAQQLAPATFGGTQTGSASVPFGAAYFGAGNGGYTVFAATGGTHAGQTGVFTHSPYDFTISAYGATNAQSYTIIGGGTHTITVVCKITGRVTASGSGVSGCGTWKNGGNYGTVGSGFQCSATAEATYNGSTWSNINGSGYPACDPASPSNTGIGLTTGQIATLSETQSGSTVTMQWAISNDGCTTPPTIAGFNVCDFTEN